jgi:hypothetical protein
VLIEDLAAAYKMPPYARLTRRVFTVKNEYTLTVFPCRPFIRAGKRVCPFPVSSGNGQNKKASPRLINPDHPVFPIAAQKAKMDELCPAKSIALYRYIPLIS